MPQVNIDKIIRKYYSGSISDDELIFLNEWLDESSLNNEVFETLEKSWQERSVEEELVNTEEMIDKIWHNGVERSISNVKPYRDWNYLLKVAVVIILFITVPFLEFMILKSTFNDEQIAKPEIIQKECPPGQKSKINLPDGSIVWLNGASLISYTTNFNESDRIINFHGEAFFEIAENLSIPFQVRSGNITTTATGTSFNIEAYKDQKKIRISLVTGEVKVNSSKVFKVNSKLKPGYQLVYKKNSHDIIKRPFNEKEVTGWTEGKLIFKSANYQEVIDKLEKWYAVKVITYGKPPENLKLTTTYDNAILINILKNIRFGKQFNYELKNDKLIMKFN